MIFRVTLPDGRRGKVRIRDQFTAGRGRVHLKLPYEGVEDEHASFERVGNAMVIRALGESTLLHDDMPVREITLDVGGTVYLGGVGLRLQFPETPDLPRKAPVRDQDDFGTPFLPSQTATLSPTQDDDDEDQTQARRTAPTSKRELFSKAERAVARRLLDTLPEPSAIQVEPLPQKRTPTTRRRTKPEVGVHRPSSAPQPAPVSEPPPDMTRVIFAAAILAVAGICLLGWAAMSMSDPPPAETAQLKR